MTIRLAAANKAQKEAMDLGAVVLFLLHCHWFKIYFLEISNRNAELIAAEEEDRSRSDSELEEAPLVKWAWQAILYDDEAEMASTLTSLP
jgi:hypothetical protein